MSRYRKILWKLTVEKAHNNQQLFFCVIQIDRFQPTNDEIPVFLITIGVPVILDSVFENGVFETTKGTSPVDDGKEMIAQVSAIDCIDEMFDHFIFVDVELARKFFKIFVF